MLPPDIAAESGYVSNERLFEWAFCGNKTAAELCQIWLDWANHYDHLVDEDIAEKKREQALHDAMWNIAVRVPQNSFFQQHQAELSVTMANAIQTWRVSTQLQRTGGGHDARLAYVLRWVPVQFFLHCARLIGGPEWEQAIAPQFWRIVTRDHSFEEFVGECGA